MPVRNIFDIDTVRRDFPILHQEVNGQPLVYLDSGATTQKPQCVIDAIVDYYSSYNANVHRAAHSLSEKATARFERAREKLAHFINSTSPREVLWTRGTTEAINLVASSWGSENLKSGDKILVSALEHHSNIVPWQLVAQQKGAEVVPIDVTENGDIDLDALDTLLGEQVKMVAVSHVSNALGTVNPVQEIVQRAHYYGAKVLIDGAQAVSHFPVDVQSLDCDFYAFSGHKLFGPTGIGVLWGRENLLEAMPPYQSGGEMIETVRFSGTTFNELPYKFEAGTPDIAGAIGLAAAIDYLNRFDRQEVAAHETQVLHYAIAKGEELSGIKRVGTAKQVAGVYSFLLEGAHPADLGTLLDQQGIAIRTGHHCAQPLMERYGISGTARASFAMYNSVEDVDRLFKALAKAKQFLL